MEQYAVLTSAVGSDVTGELFENLVADRNAPVRRGVAPNRHKIADLLDALAAVVFPPESAQQPAWIDGADDPGGVIVACANGLLHVDTTERTLLASVVLQRHGRAVRLE